MGLSPREKNGNGDDGVEWTTAKLLIPEPLTVRSPAGVSGAVGLGLAGLWVWG